MSIFCVLNIETVTQIELILQQGEISVPEAISPLQKSDKY